MDALDGNAIAGALFDVFGREMTTAAGTCKSCATKSVIAELRVYIGGPGIVARCPGCASVAMVITLGTAHLPGYELADRDRAGPQRASSSQ